MNFLLILKYCLKRSYNIKIKSSTWNNVKIFKMVNAIHVYIKYVVMIEPNVVFF